MEPVEIIQSHMKKKPDTKIVLLVLDGLGDVQNPIKGGTPLEVASKPHMDRLARESELGFLEPLGPGLTPGSGPAHLALFGYDPLEFVIGRGVLSALGIDFELSEKDVATRLNFCTINPQGEVIDRRAGRISDQENKRVCELLRSKVKLDTEWFLETVSEHRALLVLRGDGLSDRIQETDPQRTEVPPLPPKALAPEAEKTSAIFSSFIDQVRQTLKNEPAANMILARGYAAFRKIPGMEERYGLRCAAIASYPMYRGVAKLAGMTVLEHPTTLAEEVEVLARYWGDFDYFFVHVKYTDKAGEDGNFERKANVIKQVDREMVPQIRELNPTVFVITGDHSTPAIMRSHSFHPVPALLNSPVCRKHGRAFFGERACRAGDLGLRPMKDLMVLMLAHAGHLEKFGA